MVCADNAVVAEVGVVVGLEVMALSALVGGGVMPNCIRTVRTERTPSARMRTVMAVAGKEKMMKAIGAGCNAGATGEHATTMALYGL